MTQPGPGLGRTDESAPLVSWRTKTYLLMAVVAVAAAGCWHLAVVATATGVGMTDVGVTVDALVAGRPLAGLAGADPASTTITLTVLGVLLVVLLIVVTGLVVAWGSWRARRRAGKGFADRGQVRDGMGAARARSSAAQTRPGLSAGQRRRADITQVGFPLGYSHSGEPVVVALEDHVVIVAPTGAGKTRDIMGAAAVDAPGALVATCTRADLLDLCATPRSRLGRLWVFDPLDRVGWPDPMVWNPVAGCENGETAISRGLAFAAGLGADDKGSTNAGFFRANASSAMTRLLHAAALDNRPISDVIGWAIRLDNGAEEPQDLIASSTDPRAEHLWAGMLRSVATGADETVASSRQTLQQAIEPMALRRVLRWVTPRDGVPTFDAAAFVASTDTLVLVADSNASTNVAPLCAMLLQEVVDAAKARAARLPGGRLDPPLRVVGDEIANVAPLPKLPDLGTDARGFGLQLVLALQSLSQARRRWGADGAATLLDNMSAEILLGGLTDPATLRRYSELVGDVELTRATTSYDAHTGRSTTGSEQTVDRKVLRAEEARQIPSGRGLLIYRNQPAVMLTMTPWFERGDGRQLEADRARVETHRLTTGAPA